MSAPGPDLVAVAAQVDWADAAAGTEARSHADPGGGRLGELAGWLASVQGRHPAQPLKRVRAIVLGTPRPGTQAVAADLDVGLRPVDGEPGDDGAGGDVNAAFARGVALADDEADSGTDLLVLADPGDHPSSAVLVSVLTSAEPVTLLARGAAAIDTAAWIARAGYVRDGRRRALAARSDPTALLRELARPDLALATGLILQAAARHTPLILDGAATLAAALLCHDVVARSAQWWQVADRSPDPVHRAVTEELGQRPVLDLGTSCGDGVAGLLTVPLLHAVVTRAATP